MSLTSLCVAMSNKKISKKSKQLPLLATELMVKIIEDTKPSFDELIRMRLTSKIIKDCADHIISKRLKFQSWTIVLVQVNVDGYTEEEYVFATFGDVDLENSKKFTFYQKEGDGGVIADLIYRSLQKKTSFSIDSSSVFAKMIVVLYGGNIISSSNVIVVSEINMDVITKNIDVDNIDEDFHNEELGDYDYSKYLTDDVTDNELEDS